MLIGFAIAYFDPLGQVQKGRDARRQADLTQIRSALELYVNDFGHFPQTIDLGQTLEQGDEMYMVDVPRDPLCDASSECDDYLYTTDGQDSPMWYVLFAKNERDTINSCRFTCSQTDLDYTYCVFGGNIDMSVCSLRL